MSEHATSERAPSERADSERAPSERADSERADSEQPISTTKRALEELLKVEMSAAKAYGIAIRQAGDAAHAPRLVELEQEHAAAVGEVRNQLAKLHDWADIDDAGPVGKVVSLLQRAATIFGDGASLRSLRAGEETLHNYLTGIAGEAAILPDVRALVGDKLAPNTKARVLALEGLLEQRAS
jgi:hypothetical protein